MPIRSSTTDFNNLRETATRPITLIRWEHSGGLELLSLSGEVEYDGEIYTAGEVNLLSINNNNSATFTMPASTTRINQCLGGTWRGGKICQIYEIAGRIDDEDPVYTADQGFLKIDGIIDDSRYANGTITVQVLHKYLISRFTPRYYVSEFTTTIPSPGSFVQVGSDKYQLKSRTNRQLFSKLSQRVFTSKSRISVSEINSFSPPEDSLNTEVTAEGALLPIVYGRQPVPGLLCANGTDASGRYVYVVAWAIGPNLEVTSIFNNDAALPAGSIVHNYRGLKCQGVDNYAAGITTPALSYADDWVLTTPAGDVGGCYSVIVLPSGTTVAPRFQAIVKGRTVYDPRRDAGGFDSTDNNSLPDPFNQGDILAVGYNLLFYGTNGTSPTTGIDWSSNHYSVTYAGNAQIQSNKLSLDGNGDYVTVASVENTRFGSGKWTLEITCTPSVSGEVNDIFGVGDAASDRCIWFEQNATALYMYMSSNGTTWDLANGRNIYNTAFSAGVTTSIVVEYDELGYHFYINGTHRDYIASTSDLYASTATIQIGRHSTSVANEEFKGTISGVRFTKGYNRYGGVHVFDSAYTYADWNSNEAGYVYSDTAAGVLADLVKNPYYGLGSTEAIDGLLNLWKFNEADYGGVGRDTVSLVISEKRPTVEWIDLIAGTYAEAFWFVEGAGVTVKPDRLGDANNPSGWELTTNGEFLGNADDWTLGVGWSYSEAADAVIGGNANTYITQNLGKPTVAGDTYVVTLSLDVRFAGGVRVELDGITVIDEQTTAAVYAYEFISNGTESTISAVIGSSAASVIIGELSVRRKYWRDDTLVAGSLTVTPLKNSDSPNRIIASYRSATNSTANWADEVPITISMPGVGIDGTPVIETRIRYDGLKSSIRATARAKTKLYRLQGKDTVTWITTDAGLLYQRGMIIELYDAEFDLLTYAVLDSIERIEPGRYLCRGDRYSESHYPVDLPTQTGTIPVGLIAPLIGSTVPSGWQAYTPATSPTRSTYYVKCAGESLAVLTAGGATTYAGMSGDTSTDGAHGTTETTFPVKSYTGNSGAGSGALYDILAEEAGDHDHTYSTGTVTPDLYTRYFQMVKKITSTSTTWPKECLAFGQAGLHYPDMFRYTAYAKRLFAAAAAAASSGSLAQMLPITTGSTSDAHDHVNFSNVVNGSPSGTAVTDTHYAAGSGGGAHTHAVNLDLDRRVAIHKLSMYGFSVDGGVGPGMIAFWDDTLANLHQDWTLCDGRLGTRFIEGRYIEIAANGEEDEREGNNTLHITGTTAYSAKHEHQGTADTADTYAVKQLSHSEEVRHRHTIQDPATNALNADQHNWQPPHTTLYPVMYNPNPVPIQKDVAFYIDGDQEDATTTIVDISATAWPVTVAGTGTLEYTNDQQLFGVNTLYKTNTKRATLAIFPLGKKWTIQGFFRNSAAGSVAYLFSNAHDSFSSRSFLVAKDASNNIILYTGSGFSSTIRATVALGVGADEWYYVELCYDYAEFRLYAGKVASGTATRATPYASAAFDPFPHLGFFDIPQGVFQGAFPWTGYAGHIRISNGAALNSASKIAIPSAKFQNWHSSHYLSGAYDWWDPCGIVDGHYTNLQPDQEQAILPNNPGGRSSLWRETGLSDLTVSVTWPGVHADGECGLMMCVSPNETEYALGFNYESALDAWVLWKLGRQPDDIAALALTVDATHVDGTPVVLSCTISGSTITCKADGVTKITNAGSPAGFAIPAGLIGSTRHGIFIDVNRVTGRPANVRGLVADFKINDSGNDWVFFTGAWDDAAYWKDSETIYL